MKKLLLIILLACMAGVAYPLVFTLGAEVQPLISFAEQPGLGYNGTLIRSGMIYSFGSLEFLLDGYVGGQVYGLEVGVGGYASFPVFRMGGMSLRVYGGVDLGLGMFRPVTPFAYAVQGGLQYRVKMGKIRWVARVGLRYHDNPWYSANVAPMQTLDIPLYFGMEVGRK